MLRQSTSGHLSVSSASTSASTFRCRRYTAMTSASKRRTVHSTAGAKQTNNVTINGIGVSCANIPAGYHNPHKDDEYTVIAELEHTLTYILQTMTRLQKRFPHTYLSATRQWALKELTPYIRKSRNAGKGVGKQIINNKNNHVYY